jgi:hypothetical protein
MVLDFVLSYALLVAEAHHLRKLFERTVKLSRELNLSELTLALTSLKAPEDEAPSRMWRQFCIDLRHILQTHRGLAQEWQFTSEDRKVLEEYLAGNELLVQCLKLAYVPDRQAIEDRLLLPPVVQAKG